MKTIETAFLVLSCTIISLSTGSSFAQEKTITQLQIALVSPWLVTIKDQARTLLLKITSVKQKDDQAFVLDATYGFIDGKPLPVEAEVIQTAKERKLLFVTQSGNRYVAIQAPNGTFEGTYTDAAGIIKAVTIEKLSEDQLRMKMEFALKPPEIHKPGADVPAQCATFSGGWTGTWGYGTGQAWLWVVGVDANCVAMYAYVFNPRPPAGFLKAEIKKGDLSLPCGNGTCVFEHHGDELWGRYSGPEGINNVVLRKVQ